MRRRAGGAVKPWIVIGETKCVGAKPDPPVPVAASRTLWCRWRPAGSSGAGGGQMTAAYPSIERAEDIVQFLKAQHEEIKSRFQQVISATGEERQAAFDELRRLLAVHETAEEEVVHPRAKRAISGGEAIVDARLTEENEAKKVLAELEKLDVNSAEFEQRFQAFRNDVIQHAEAEEHQEFASLQLELDDEQLRRMRNAVKLAEATAPTRPHPGVESATANMLAGPFASMLDRARDLITGKS
jgi:hemerythrin superfamily protein